MNNLCYDMIQELTNYCDSQTVASLLSINSYFYQHAKSNVQMKTRKQLSYCLSKTIPKTRKYYKSTILDLKVGDRVCDLIANYQVYYVEKKFALLQVVDLYGHPLDESLVYTDICNIKKYNQKIKNNLYWATYHYNTRYDIPIIIKLKYGLIKHSFGPSITHINSHYLNYKTNQQNPFGTDDPGIPEINQMVTISYKWTIYEYIIITLDDESMVLQRYGHFDVEPFLQAHKITNEWKLQTKKYNIVMFGGYKLI